MISVEVRSSTNAGDGITVQVAAGRGWEGIVLGMMVLAPVLRSSGVAIIIRMDT